MQRIAQNRSRAATAAVFCALLSLSGTWVEPDLRRLDPLLAATDSASGGPLERRAAGAPGARRAFLPVFVHLRFAEPRVISRLEYLGAAARRVHGRLFAAHIPLDATRYISNWEEVAYIEGGRTARPLLDLSRTAVDADQVQAGSPARPPFDGTGVYLAIVDTGLSDTHDDFRFAGPGSPLRVDHTYGPNPLQDPDGHGTHVAGIAAGNGFLSARLYTGMAPAAKLLIGKTNFSTVDIVEAADDLFVFANDSPVALNLSLGTPMGPHDGTSGFESAIDALAAQGPRRIVAAAAGNEKGAGEHHRADLPPFGAATLELSFAATPAGNPSIESWADGADRYNVTASLLDAGGSVIETVTVSAGSEARSPGNRIFVSNGVAAPPNGATQIYIVFDPAVGNRGLVRFERTRNGGSGRIDSYTDAAYGRFTTSQDFGTVTEPANGANVVAVGSFNTKTWGGAQAPHDLSSFSSLGPARDGRFKPDICSPGSVVYSARAQEADPPPGPVVPENDRYVILQGTSMAAPHVAGVAALVWQSNPGLSGAQVRARLLKTADPPPDGSRAPNNAWGYGKLNALRAVTESVAWVTAPARVAPGTAVLLTTDKSSGAMGKTLTAFEWRASAGSTVSPASDGATATFFAPTEGDYQVTLTVSQAEPAGTPPGSDTVTIRVNREPTARVSGPSSAGIGTPVSLSGSASSDPDGGSLLRLWWIMVARPPGSGAQVTASGSDNAVFTPDVAGRYEIGLRADDGLDNSGLAVHVVDAQPAGGRSGGCTVAPGTPGYSGAVGDIALAAAVILPALRRRAVPRGKRGTLPASPLLD